jgi:hypothetical protein
MMISTILRAAASSVAGFVADSSAASESAKWASIGSLEFWLKQHHERLISSLVIIAASLCKRAQG